MRSQPNSLSQSFQRADRLHQDGDLERAGRLYRSLLNAQPNNFDVLHRFGVLNFQRGRHEEALSHMLAALKIRPNEPVVLSNLGLVEAALNRPERALERHDAALAIAPRFAEAHNRRGTALWTLGRLDEALDSYRRAVEFQPNLPEAHNNLGMMLRELGRHAEALASQDRALALRPGYWAAHNHRGLALEALDRFDEALAAYDAALALKPDFAEALNNRGNALRALGRPLEALDSHQRALALNMNHAGAHNNLAISLAELGRHDEALDSYDRALALNPGFAEAADNKGLLLTDLGRLDEAAAAIKAAIEINPRRIRSYYNLTQSKRIGQDDLNQVEAMRGLAKDMAALTLHERIDLCFALGKALADLGDHAGAFEALISGNALKRRMIAYDEAATLALFERLRAAYAAERFASARGQGAASAGPVFVLGMPRSGTTLLEQILASHPQVRAFGEVETWLEAVKAAGGRVAATPTAPEVAAELCADDLLGLGRRYLAAMGLAEPSDQRVVNKTTENFRHVGLIHMALPQARIIHARRDPLDTCVSCFSKQFTGELFYAYDLAELGRYYRAYERLMDHWREVLPPGVMLDVRYEDVVDDLEGQARRIVAHCGLDWDPRCLDFHETARAVRTASAVQVREPINTRAVGGFAALRAL
jgi:tetratricopeptide (TPR) repeat protein